MRRGMPMTDGSDAPPAPDPSGPEMSADPGDVGAPSTSPADEPLFTPPTMENITAGREDPDVWTLDDSGTRRKG